MLKIEIGNNEKSSRSDAPASERSVNVMVVLKLDEVN